VEKSNVFGMRKPLGLLGFVLIFAVQANSASANSKASQAAQIYYNNERAAAQAQRYHHRPNFDHRDAPVSLPMSSKFNTLLYEPPYRSCRGSVGCR
jgi:hypothetical protein